MNNVPAAESPWTPRRVTIRDWLNKTAVPLAEIYAGTVELLATPIPGRGRLIAHGVREIGNGLARFLASPTKGQVQYRQHVDKLLKEWRAAGLPMDLAPPALLSAGGIEGDIVPISRSVVTKIIVLLVDHEAGSVRSKNRFVGIYEALNAEQPSVATLKPTVERLGEVCEWFVERVHITTTPDSEIFTEEFRRQFQVFEDLLYALCAPFYTALDDVDAILAEANA